MVERMEEQMKQLTKAYREELTQIEVCKIYSGISSTFSFPRATKKGFLLTISITFQGERVSIRGKILCDLTSNSPISFIILMEEDLNV